METPVRVVIADDDVLLREGVASLLARAGFDVVGQAGDGDELLAMVRDVKPELVVADIRMPPTHTNEGLAAARVIRDERPDTRSWSCPRMSTSKTRWSCSPAATESGTC